MEYCQGWDIEVLRRIICYFYNNTVRRRHGIRIFAALLPVASVCRVWREHTLAYVYKTAYLEQPSMTGDSGPVWVSNIGLIVSQRRSDYIRQLEINIYDDRASGTAVAALDEYGFSSVYWPRLSRLHLYCLYFQSFISPRDSEEKMATRIANYFINHLPNLACLHLDISNTGEGCEVFLNKMANAYLPRLHTLYTGNKVGITFNAHNRFGENLTYLTLKMNTDSSNRLPWIMAAQLQYLKLTDIPEHFTWSTFYSDSPSSVTFANLQKLFMFFKSETLAELLHRGNDSESKIMRIINQDANNRQLRFPKLQTLSLSRNPYSDSAFYERFVQAPLRTVNISGSFRSMHSMHNEMLVDLYKLTLDIKRIGDDYGFNDVSLFLSRLFYTPSSVQVAELFAYYRNMQPLYIKGSIGWYNIERLELYVDVYLSSIVNLAKQCSKLKELFVVNLVNDLGNDNLSANISSQEATQEAITGCVLEHLSIGRIKDNELQTDIASISYLVLLIRSLRKLAIPEELTAPISGLISEYSATFPHVNNIAVSIR